MKAVIAFLLVLIVASSQRILAEEIADPYRDKVQPYVKKYCAQCHHGEKAKGDLDLTRFADSNDVIANFRRWNNILEFIRGGEMPPKDALQPTLEENDAVVGHVTKILISEAKKHAGDPGIVLPRRLSNTEYDLSVRELTGIDIHPTKELPPDPAGGEGFDNTGESLGMSPNLLKKYLSTAQSVADHLVLKTNGISFSAFPVTSYNERKKLTEQAIIDFYEHHSVDTLTYLDAAWRYRYRKNDREKWTVQQWAEDSKLSPRYLAIVWDTLSNDSMQTGFLNELGQAWNAIPAPTDEKTYPVELLHLRKGVEHYRRILTSRESELIKSNAGNWPIGHLDYRNSIAAARDKFSSSNLKSETLLKFARISAPNNGSRPKPMSAFLRIEKTSSSDECYVLIKRSLFSKIDRLPNNPKEMEQQEAKTLRSVLESANPDLATSLGFGQHPLGSEIDPDSFIVRTPFFMEIPLDEETQRQLDEKNLLIQCQLDSKLSREGSVLIQHSMRERSVQKWEGRFEMLMFGDSRSALELNDSATKFCHAFPNRFFYVDKDRGLAAGFHLVEGFFRDDRPLMQKVLSESERHELDQLWRELEFVTESAETLLRGFVWFERSEREVLHDPRFDFLRAEDPRLVEEEMLSKFEKLYLDKMGIQRIGDTLETETPTSKYAMIRSFFDQIRTGLSQHKDVIVRAEQLAFTNIEKLASRAYRRELQSKDRNSLRGLYHKLRAEGQDVEPALRGMLTAILMSPDFFYRANQAPEGDGTYPLSDSELASRLSYFLWSSLPDEELMAAANSGKLQSEEGLLQQARRMLKSPRMDAFSREFFGQWLRYRDYLTKDPIHAQAFRDYDDELRQAMFEEPTRLATYLIQADLPVTDLLTSDVTYVNQRLAKHYGGEIEKQFQGQNLKLRNESGSANTSSANTWLQVSGLRQSGRGGLFGMAVILAKNSAGERTSPVKRGFWSVHHLLGQHFPPPPADVPELPTSEKGADRTIRELLALHVAAQQCAMCHKHFDGLGLALEGFDAIGRKRTADSGGRVIDSRAELPNGQTAEGIPGLIDYMMHHRRKDFLQTLCRKFLGYALSRSVKLSDQPLLDEMDMALEKNHDRFSVLFDSVIRSPQFRTQRGRDVAANSR
ncbi:MAG: DUF1592 domain-containing protein [Pirellula sp.]